MKNCSVGRGVRGVSNYLLCSAQLVAMNNLVSMIKPISVAQYDARLTGDQEVAGRQHSFVEIDHEIFSTVILSFPLIQDGQLSVSGDKCVLLDKRTKPVQ